MGAQDTSGGEQPSTHSRLQTLAVYVVLPLWAVSILVSMAAQIVGFTYAAPSELNLAGTAVLGFVLAKTQVGKPTTTPPPPPPPVSTPAGGGDR